jgi:hypothetical protein
MVESSRFQADDTPARTPPAAGATIEVECPECGSAVEITEALTKGIREQALREANVRAEERFRVRLREEQERARADAKAAATLELETLRERTEIAERTSRESKERELVLRNRMQAFEQEQQDWELTKARERDAMRAEAVREAAHQAAEAQALELKRKEEQYVLLLQQKDAERDLELKQKDIERDGLKKQVEDLSRRLKQGSQQSQGEALEASLEEMLQREFPHDSIEPVPKGITGADVIQRVRTDTGIECGTILWEAKRTKHWTAGWLPKLRDDQRALKAELAALVSTVLPKDAKPVGLLDNVWVSDFACAAGLGRALRLSLLEAAKAKQALVGKSEKIDMLYAYFSGPEFKNRIEGLLEPFMAMRADLEKEKRSIQRLWAAREKQIERALGSTSGLYGDLQGIVGASLPALEALDLPAMDEGDA